MPLFHYTVRDATGAIRTGASEAESEDILKSRLQQQGFRITDVKNIPVRRKRRLARRMHRRIRQGDRVAFWLEFSLLLDSNAPLLHALQICGEQTASREMRAVLHQIIAEMGAGSALFDAMSRYPAAFDSLAVGMIRAGEVGGALPEAVRRLCRYQEGDARWRTETHQRTIIIAILLTILSFLLYLGVTRPGH